MTAAPQALVPSREPAAGAPDKGGTGGKGGFFALELLDDRYPALHGARVLAIVSVVQFHVSWIFWGEQHVGLDRAFVDGSLRVFFGMDLFFVLSGFLIGSILLRSLERSGTVDLGRFYLRRVLRTFPSYYVVLTALALATHLTDGQRRHLVYEYVYGTNFLPIERADVIMFWGWSLSLEEQFYLAVPALFFVLHRLRSDRARLALLSTLWAGGLAARVVVYLLHRPWTDHELYLALYFRTPTRFDTIVAGILLAFVHRRHGPAIGRWLEAPLHRAALGMSSLLCLWVLLRPGMFGDEHVQQLHLFAWGTLPSLMYFGVVPLLLHGEGWVHRALSRPIFRRLATLGYGVYLVHIPLIDHLMVPAARAAEARHVSMGLVWGAAVAAVLLGSFAVAYAMHLLIEKPSLWLRRRLAG